LADQVSDAILDHFLALDPGAKVACETFVSAGLVVVAGEFETTPPELFDQAQSKIPQLVRSIVREVGFDGTFPGIDQDRCEIRLQFNRQSSDIHRGVEQEEGVIGAGDQGLVFGYATDETPELMPLPLLLAHRLVERQAKMRRSGEVSWLRPDAKSQVSVRYSDERPVGVETVVLSTQHTDDLPVDTVRRVVESKIVLPLIPPSMRCSNFRVLINPTGRFVVGGPEGDTGLTGRKIIVDTYGGRCPHGGGAFSGKDPTKVDRSAAYAARYVAKNIVAAALAERCTVQIAYSIGVPEPVSLFVDTHGTGILADTELEAAVRKVFDLTPAGIIHQLDLRRPIFRKTAVYGHFGRSLPGFSWERTDRVDDLKEIFRVAHVVS
jgi:S-adenosylmethionine synthetase